MNAAKKSPASPHPAPVDESAAELLDVGAVASLLGCSKRHVYRLSDAGAMPRPVHLGALVRWPRRAVLDWISAGCPQARRAAHR